MDKFWNYVKQSIMRIDETVMKLKCHLFQMILIMFAELDQKFRMVHKPKEFIL